MARSLESELSPRPSTENPRTQTFELLDHSDVAPGLFELSFNLDGSKVNKLSPTVVDALDQRLEALRDRGDVKALVFTSGKDAGGFIAGADIEVIRAVQ